MKSKKCKCGCGRLHYNKKFIKRMLNRPVYYAEKSPNWCGGISKYPYDWEFNNNLKKQIAKRDNYVCQFPICNNKVKKGVCHHIHYIKNDSRPETLVWSCKRCNLIGNGSRDYWFAYFCYIKNINPEEVLL